MQFSCIPKYPVWTIRETEVLKSLHQSYCRLVSTQSCQYWGWRVNTNVPISTLTGTRNQFPYVTLSLISSVVKDEYDPDWSDCGSSVTGNSEITSFAPFSWFPPWLKMIVIRCGPIADILLHETPKQYLLCLRPYKLITDRRRLCSQYLTWKMNTMSRPSLPYELWTSMYVCMHVFPFD